MHARLKGGVSLASMVKATGLKLAGNHPKACSSHAIVAYTLLEACSLDPRAPRYFA
jgi:hypothetical protein